MKRNSGKWMATGLVLGMMLSGPAATAAENWLKAVPTWQPIYIDGEQVNMTAYNINGNNYVKLRDIGREVGFNVYWQDGVQVESQNSYTGEPPVSDASEAPDVEEIRLDIVQGINALRREADVPELTVNDALMDAAQICAERKWSSHHNREECEIVSESGYPYGFRCNLTNFSGAGDRIAQEAVSNWQDSPGHYQTAIDPSCDTIGVGVYQTPVRTYCIMLVGNPNSCNPYA